MDMDKSNPIASSSSSLASETKENVDGSNDNLSRATKNWKRIKEISGKEEKRPPWKVVSVSTLPKADKNAILRAKLLDASRRMRATKVPVAVQTDIVPVKLLKEVNVDIQSDLIKMVDAENLTDGTITFKPDGPIILTYSVAQMTDTKETQDTGTQTATPGISHRFFDKYLMKNNSHEDDEDSLDLNFTKNELKLLNQIKEIRSLDKQIERNLLDSNRKHRTETDSNKLLDDSLSKDYFNISNTNRLYSLQGSTTSSWNFDFTDNSSKIMESCSSTNNRSNVSWMTRNMKLLPNSERSSLLTIKSKTKISDGSLISAISELLNATNMLLDIFKRISIVLGPDINIKNITEDEYKVDIQFLSNHWRPILRDIAHLIEEKLRNLEGEFPKSFSNLNSDF